MKGGMRIPDEESLPAEPRGAVEPSADGIRRDFVAGFRACVPLAVAVFGFAVSFGIVARAANMGWLPPLVMSATTFAGSAQFAAASVLATGGGASAAIVAAILLNARYIPIGISVAPVMTGGVLRRLLAAQLVVDESWAVGHLGGGRYSRGRLIGAGVLIFVAWVGGTAVGLLGANAFGDPARFGLDVVSPSLFLALLFSQVKESQAVAATLGAAIALLLTPLVSPGIPLVVASSAALIGLRRR
jgi:4-azaleucine resistance transporter AzlC